MSGAEVQWIQCPEKPEAIAAMLLGGVTDVALLYTEDAISQVAKGRALKVCGTLQAAPREWCLLVPRHSSGGQKVDPEDEAITRVAVPRGLAARVMLAVVGDLLSWAEDPEPIEQDCLENALDALLLGLDDVQALLWESSELLRLGTLERCVLLAEVPMDWPSHLWLASSEALCAKRRTIESFIAYTGQLCKEFKANHENASADYLSQAYAMGQQEAESWLDGGLWSCSCEVEEISLTWPMDLMSRLGLVPADHAEGFQASRSVAACATLRRASTQAARS